MIHSKMRATGLLAATLFFSGNIMANESTVWIGTALMPGGESRGIYRAALDLETGELTKPTLAADIAAPGFLVLHPAGKRMYATCQLPNGEGGVASFAISGDTRKLDLLNTQPTGDGEAAHIAIDLTGRCLFTAQYGGGSVAVFPLDDGGEVLPRSALVEHAGSGPNRERQEAAHPHWVGVDPANRYLFVPDLGIDQIVIYRIDLDSGEIERHGHGQCAPGSGPRHMKFHPNGKIAYVLNELDLTVAAFQYDAAAGALNELQTISTLPTERREVSNSASEIRIHPSGKFLYTANRGHDSIAAFAIDESSGRLTFIELESVRGSHPRNFNLDPTGKWLVAAGRDSNTLALFRIDPKNGGLVFTGKSVYCPAPICVEFQAPLE